MSDFQVPGGKAIAHEVQLMVCVRNGWPVMEAYMPPSVPGDCDAHVRERFFHGFRQACERAYP